MVGRGWSWLFRIVSVLAVVLGEEGRVCSFVSESVESFESLGDVAPAFFEAFDFAVPVVLSGFVEAFVDVDGDFLEPVSARWFDVEHGAAHAGVFVDAWGAVGAVAGSERDAA